MYTYIYIYFINILHFYMLVHLSIYFPCAGVFCYFGRSKAACCFGVLGAEQEDDFHWTAEQDPGSRTAL